MISALLLFTVLPRLASQLDPPSSAQQSFSVAAADSAAVRQIYGIGVFANPASKASLSVDSGILRAEFDLASDSTEGYSANVGLTLPFAPDGNPVRLGGQGSPHFNRFQFEYRLSDRIPNEWVWTLESEAYPPPYVKSGHYLFSLTDKATLAASTTWNTVFIQPGDIWSQVDMLWAPVDDFPSLDSVLTSATGFRIEPTTLYSESGAYSMSGFPNGVACTKCVNPTMKHLVMELRKIRIDRLGPAGDTVSLVLGQPKPLVGVAHRMAFRPVDISWHGGILQIANPARWISVAVLAPDGRRLRTLPPASSQKLDLPPGSYRVLLRGRDGSQAVRNLIRIR